ncbi:MAG: hypothetical protein AABW41_03790 [Nanoarchaeota archaeon]
MSTKFFVEMHFKEPDIELLVSKVQKLVGITSILEECIYAVDPIGRATPLSPQYETRSDETKRACYMYDVPISFWKPKETSVEAQLRHIHGEISEELSKKISDPKCFLYGIYCVSDLGAYDVVRKLLQRPYSLAKRECGCEFIGDM